MANPEHLAILKQGVEKWNQWREEHFRGIPDLTGAVFGRSMLRKVDLNGAYLNEVDFGEANLFAANFGGAYLIEANLGGACLSAANLRRANLGNADLSNADLTRADLRWASLDLADLHRAKVGETTFANVDLSSVKGLETVKHSGPSSVGIDTIYKSKGKIPPVFLRGCGVPEALITYLPSLLGTGIEFYSLFISYSTKAQDFADRLHADLQAKGVRCWFAPHNMRSGKKVHEQIDEAIRVYDKLLLLLSPESMASTWVNREIFKARERELRDKRRVLFPIRLCSFEELRDWKLEDGDSGQDLAREIREYFIPDFSNWTDPTAYKLAFDRLLEDLQGKPDAPSV